MYRSNDNWERLVEAVLRKEQLRELCYLSETSSLCSSSFCSLNSEDLELEESLSSPDQQHPSSGKVSRASYGELIAAGWPNWLAEVAGEAIQGWVPRRLDTFKMWNKIFEGARSRIYRGRDLMDGKIVALKKVKFDKLKPDSIRYMAREINILRRLDHPNIIKLNGLITSRRSSSLYLVFEYMERNLTQLASWTKYTESHVKSYTQQLLNGLDHCHSRGVLHRDIKGSHLLIDNSGTLKIAGFGMGSFCNPRLNQPLTSRVVTLWYRPPELLLGATSYDIGVDLWSTGCLLAELYAGKPIMPGRTEVDQLHKIFKLCGSPSEEYWRKSKPHHVTVFKPQQPYKRRVTETFKDFPAPTLALIDILLSLDPADRGSAASALENEYFTKEPLPHDPPSLPKHPDLTDELDAKLGDMVPMRKMDGRSKSLRHDYLKKEGLITESLAIPGPDANAEIISITQRNDHPRPLMPVQTMKVEMLEDHDHQIPHITGKAWMDETRYWKNILNDTNTSYRQIHY